MSARVLCSTLVTLAVAISSPAQNQPDAITVQVAKTGKPISPDLFGIFFEDLNYAADGGLYAELVQNRSFEYQATEQITWNAMTAWEQTIRGGGKGSFSIETSVPVDPNNPHYVVIENQQPGDGVGLVNSGFDGIPVEAGAQYDFSVFARQLFTGGRWGGNGVLTGPAHFIVRLETKDRVPLGEGSFDVSGRDWQRVTAMIIATNTEPAARLAVLSMTRGGVALDEVSLFPHHTFHDRANGLRADLAQTIADLHPKFMRFPGGCLVHGQGLNNLYHWKDSIGPTEQRRGQLNLWGYHQSLGLGFYEYFQFCEDIGAKPLPVVPAGVCCQNADHQGGTGQRGLPMELMPVQVQDVLDLIEWANGPTNSTWGAKRAAAGHPAPFNLQYLGVGNEEHITSVFQERFQMIYAAVKAKHPEITVIGTVGPFPDGEDYDAGWKIADALGVDIVDEHYYEKPDWFFNHLTRYDSYDRKRSKVYLGEYAAQDEKRASNLRTALAEAAYLTSLERNGDVVRLASYAPLLCRQGHSQWRPDLIYFDATRVLRTVNYYVQELFSANEGDIYFPTTLAPPASSNAEPARLQTSCVQDSKTGDVMFKLVNDSTNTTVASLDLSSFPNIQPKATSMVLTGDPSVSNSLDKPDAIQPTVTEISVGKTTRCEILPYSLTVVRFKTR